MNSVSGAAGFQFFKLQLESATIAKLMSVLPFFVHTSIDLCPKRSNGNIVGLGTRTKIKSTQLALDARRVLVGSFVNAYSTLTKL